MTYFSRFIDKLKFIHFERSINENTWSYHDSIVAWADEAARNANMYESEEQYAASDDPIVRLGYRLRRQVLESFKDKCREVKNVRVLLHVPPSNVSPGGFSLFNNMAQSLDYLGISTRLLYWDMPTRSALEEIKPNILLTSDSVEYLRRIDWSAIDAYKQKHELHIGLTASLQEYGNTPLRERMAWAAQHGVDFYYSFRPREYLAARKEYEPFFEKGYRIFSIEFGANPLLYYPVPVIRRDLDYVFLASVNRAKLQRYFDYLPAVVNNYKGFIAGPGWKGSRSFTFHPGRDRYLYSRAKVGINLHLKEQIEYPCELNERTYMLAACGIPQLIDNPRLLPQRFSDGCFFVAEGPTQYNELFDIILHNEDNSKKAALRALNEVYEKHTTFHRSEDFIRELLIYYKDLR